MISAEGAPDEFWTTKGVQFGHGFNYWIKQGLCILLIR